MNHQSPHQDCRQGHGHVPVNSQNVRGPEHAGELRHHIAEVYDQNDGHQEKRYAKAKLLAYQVRETFAGVRPQARTHFQRHVKHQRHRNQGPKDSISKLRPRLRVRVDPAGIVVHVGNNQAGPHNRKKQRDAFSERPDYAPNAVDSLIPTRPPGGYVCLIPHKMSDDRFPYRSSFDTTSSTVMVPIGRFSPLVTVNVLRLYLSNRAKTSLSSAFPGTLSSGSIFSPVMRCSFAASRSRATGTAPENCAAPSSSTMVSSWSRFNSCPRIHSSTSSRVELSPTKTKSGFIMPPAVAGSNSSNSRTSSAS